MNKLPQELVDTIIDNLAEFDTPLEPEISRYSTVSRRWVRRTQKHHFKLVILRKEASLKRWRKNTNPDPSDASRHEILKRDRYPSPTSKFVKLPRGYQTFPRVPSILHHGWRRGIHARRYPRACGEDGVSATTDFPPDAVHDHQEVYKYADRAEVSTIGTN